ncbi:unnamed protein product [Symbiodinium sp. CCMP2592]|nr:unnamed protein product [Symbiodinium sp. CCMP2592]
MACFGFFEFLKLEEFKAGFTHEWAKLTAAKAAKQERTKERVKLQDLSEFGIDTAALAKLGIDEKAQERVCRAMVVHSHGLRTVFQEASSRASNSKAALQFLWRAFQAVLEQEEGGRGEVQEARSGGMTHHIQVRPEHDSPDGDAEEEDAHEEALPTALDVNSEHEARRIEEERRRRLKEEKREQESERRKNLGGVFALSADDFDKVYTDMPAVRLDLAEVNNELHAEVPAEETPEDALEVEAVFPSGPPLQIHFDDRGDWAIEEEYEFDVGARSFCVVRSSQAEQKQQKVQECQSLPSAKRQVFPWPCPY